jgi:hypothetical protein
MAMSAAGAQEFHVAPNGNDANPGTAAAPLRTLAGARDAVRKVNKGMTGDITVSIHNVQNDPAIEGNAGIKPGYNPRDPANAIAD